MKSISQRIYEYGIVPVVKLEDAGLAVPLANALMAGGLKCIEVTFRTDAAEQAIRNISQECKDMLVGAGTVLTVGQIERAVAAGARFIVTPGFNPTTAGYCVEHGIPVFPGCSDPASIEAALELGISDLKFFPAEPSGGLPMIRSLCAPYTKVRFMPTGGVNDRNMNEYLSYDKILACGGTWMVKEDLIRERRFDEIERLTRNTVMNMLGFELRHVGINCTDEGQAFQRARRAADLFGLEVKAGNSSVFAGKAFEMMKSETCGEKGHICMAVNNLDRACAYFSERGVRFVESSRKYSDEGKLKVVNLEEQLGGFVLQLVNK
ncbi:bifunctional 4-hydroxy-2-oxoglutarate aldolase/2-dehydro-3-deoxy-phosphogluconate aldolase [Lacrimispora sp. NSJ-141]|uniref:2-dehydro-3-deoxy-phosphogluconate aldolase n=1 Tax=Lientehia hominis TaxID=2897778 RepID=A0AAP2RJF2_9FIRM|nr:bifunctional 4-hydroxy-2-oxoglutarate aldolase/2-dehydro-3-deoxy-phosphogluconate aldolase [Lientehia hominis]MCD2492000.1 bifunctional 4-hydroxy-2-oxoglutarate aldolase/2-dehydro-3-deoxy-phosphogluconate aldolase [Lientehia hominis]